MNELKHKADFEAVLAGYEPSAAARDTLQHTRLVLLVGTSSSGRNTIINELLKSGAYHYIVSDTTRQPRTNDGVLEQNGREYWFRTEDEMLAELKRGEFLEAAIIHDQQVSGISIRELKVAADEDKTAINEIEVVGADNIYAAKPDTLFFFVLPPSFDEWMARMSARGALPEDEIRRRLESAVKELTTALARPYYRFVVNDTFTHAAKRIDAIVNGAEPANDQAQAKDIAGRILNDTKQYLADK